MPLTPEQIAQVLPTVDPPSLSEAPVGASLLRSHLVSEGVASAYNLPSATKGGQAAPWGQVVSLVAKAIASLSGYIDAAVLPKADKRSRQSVSINLGTLAAGSSGQASIDLGKSFKLLRIETTAPCWFRLYSTAVYRTMDGNRVIGAELAPGNGLISEVIFAGVLGYDLDNTHGSSMQSDRTVALSVVNTSSAPAALALTFTYLILED